MSTLYGYCVTFLMSLDFKSYSKKNYVVTCTVLCQGNVQDTNEIYSSFLPNVRPETCPRHWGCNAAGDADVKWSRRD
jgi:hypothetical protein